MSVAQSVEHQVVVLVVVGSIPTAHPISYKHTHFSYHTRLTWPQSLSPRSVYERVASAGVTEMTCRQVKQTLKSALAVFVLAGMFAAPVAAGPFEDGTAAYNRGDYAAALHLWLARQRAH